MRVSSSPVARSVIWEASASDPRGGVWLRRTSYVPLDLGLQLLVREALQGFPDCRSNDWIV